MRSKEILREYAKLRKRNIHLIAVSNSEWYSLFRDEIRNSIAIEGIFANRNELLDVLEKNKRTNNQKTAAILGYYEAAATLYEYANNLVEEDEFGIRMSDVKQIHTILLRYEKQVGSFRGKLGDFRHEQVEVNQSTFTPVHYDFIRATMELFLRWLNQKLREPDYDKIKLAAQSHVFFETIHPFRDGNGRAGRILLSFILIGCGFANIAIKGVQKTDRNRYYDAMERGDDLFEAMMRKIEAGKKITLREVSSVASRSKTELLEDIIRKRLEDGLQRLGTSSFIKANLDAEVPLREAGKFFNYSQDYLRNLINDGRLPATKKGKLWYIRVRDVDKYIRETKE